MPVHTKTIEDLATKAFRVIATHLFERTTDIARFCATQYSFEEWLNWEAFAACSKVPTWSVHPKPRYHELGVVGCKDFGDLSVADGSNRSLIEVGLVHDGTGTKWQAKLDNDMQKLARQFRDGIVPLQIIVLVSRRKIDASKKWQQWLNQMPCWVRPTTLAMSTELPPDGQMLIRGWRNVHC